MLRNRLIFVVFVVVACLMQPQQKPVLTSRTLPLSESALSAQAATTSVIVDTDMGADDMMALLYLLQKPDITIKAITVSGTGLAHCTTGIQHALSLITAVEFGDIPVACGRETPLQGDHAFPQAFRESTDNLTGLPPLDSSGPGDQDAVELLASTLRESPGAIDVLALGPLTNIAELLQQHTDMVGRIASITIMGGAVNVPGTVMDSPAAEWNIWIDPVAAEAVFESGVPITLVPLDATNDVPITRAFYEMLDVNRTTPAATLLHELFTANPHLYAEGMYFWDPLAAAVLADPTLVTLETLKLKVITGGADSGRIVTAEDGTEMKVAVAAEAPLFEHVFLSTLNGGKDLTLPAQQRPENGAEDGTAISAPEEIVGTWRHVAFEFHLQFRSDGTYRAEFA